ncbi:hypothetical protein Sjap_005501 [Stephania japonica]|uniref:NAC domain-containing protein n=1 Tax=Stephania japonica TaxID=461633 RepID=A0AAP0PI17_9MAGN
MEENQMNNNLLQLPWGFTFNPTDEEIMRYLRAKVENIQLPFLDPIPEFDVYTVEHPSQLLNQGLNEIHLFFYVKKSGRYRRAGNGYWNASAGPFDVFSREGELIGQRRSLVYHNSKKRKRSTAKTRWIMNEYRLPDLHPMLDSSSKAPTWTLCKIGETGRTGGYDEQVLSPPEQPEQPQQQIQQVDNMELVPYEVTDQQPEQQPEFDEELQHWINNLDASPELEIDDQSTQQLFDELHQQLQVQQQHTDNAIAVEDYDDTPPYICLDGYQSQHQQLMVLPDELDDCNEGIENLTGNFTSWMDVIKKRGQDQVVDGQQQQVEEDDQEEPLPKRAKE